MIEIRSNTPEEKVAITRYLRKPEPPIIACGCMGPQNGEPLCPCAMHSVVIVKEKYYQVQYDSIDGKRVYTARQIK